MPTSNSTDSLLSNGGLEIDFWLIFDDFMTKGIYDRTRSGTYMSAIIWNYCEISIRNLFIFPCVWRFGGASTLWEVGQGPYLSPCKRSGHGEGCRPILWTIHFLWLWPYTPMIADTMRADTVVAFLTYSPRGRLIVENVPPG